MAPQLFKDASILALRCGRQLCECGRTEIAYNHCVHTAGDGAGRGDFRPWRGLKGAGIGSHELAGSGETRKRSAAAVTAEIVTHPTVSIDKCVNVSETKRRHGISTLSQSF